MSPTPANGAPRLLVLTGSNAIGGMERVAVTIAHGLAERGWDTRALFSAGAERELIGWAQGQRVAAEAHDAVRTIDEPRSVRDLSQLRRLVRDWAPDVINVHYPGGHISLKDIIALRAGMRGRLMVNVHLPVPWSESGDRKRQMTRLAAMLCDRIIVHSRAMASIVLEAGVPRHKVELIHNGSPVQTGERDQAAARRRFDLEEGQLVVGTMARLAPIKGIDTLIEAMAMMPSCAVLFIAGDGPERKSLQALAKERLGARVRFAGAVTDEPSDVYAAMDVFVLSSRLEGFPMVLLEAALRAKAIVATDVGGVSEIVEHGRSGLVVPPGDPAALAEAIDGLLRDQNQREMLAVAARCRVADLFSESRMLDRYASLFATPAGSAR